jgi:predicted RNase H-like nuclease
MFYVGADGCKAGWFAVRLEDRGSWKVEVFENIKELWEQYKEARFILLDIPIGLPHRAHKVRSCDIEAKKLLVQRRSSVFLAPCRRAVSSDNYEEASKINRDETDRGLSKQAWGIVPKIKEVDQLLSVDMSTRSRIREIHPEVCFFWALNGKSPMAYSKKKKDGVQERKEVLRSVYPYSEAIFKDVEQKYTEHEYFHKDVGWDDILDALVAAVTAYEGRQGLKSIPEKPELDSHGLRMEMVYFLPAN